MKPYLAFLFMAVALSGCGGSDGEPTVPPIAAGDDPGTPPAAAIPAIPANLTLTYSAKGYNFTWTADTASTSYRVLEDADGPGPAETTLAGTTTSAALAYVPPLLHTRLAAQYRVQACNAAGCSPASAAISPDAARAIGYFKSAAPANNEQFGWSVAVSGDGTTLALGGFNAAGIQGAVLVYSRTAGAWGAPVLLTAANSGVAHNFGWSIALSDDGNTLAAGAPGEESGVAGDPSDTSAFGAGAVYVFQRSGGTWTQQAYLKAHNIGANRKFGNAVALSADGNTLATGAPFEGSSHAGTYDAAALPADNNGTAFSGAVYVHKRTGSAWSPESYIKAWNPAMNAGFGGAVALSADGTTLAAGASMERAAHMGVFSAAALPAVDTNASASGAVYVYKAGAGMWALESYIKSGNSGAGDQFGTSLALSGNGDVLAVGAPREDGNGTGVFAAAPADGNLGNTTGAVYLFSRSAGAWSPGPYLKPAESYNYYQFGLALALSGDGTRLAVGASTDGSAALGFGGAMGGGAPDSGAVHLFRRAGPAWAPETFLKASNTRAAATFGSAVALSRDGSALAVGASQESGTAGGVRAGVGLADSDGATFNAGGAYLF